MTGDHIRRVGHVRRWRTRVAHPCWCTPDRRSRIPAGACHNDAVTSGEASTDRRLAGWGRVPVVPGYQIRSENLEAITVDVPLTRGLGRAYGDAALPAP